MSVLRRPLDHHRDLPPRHHPALAARPAASRDQDRHAMTKADNATPIRLSPDRLKFARQPPPSPQEKGLPTTLTQV
jgi:hypothetical protein